MNEPTLSPNDFMYEIVVLTDGPDPKDEQLFVLHETRAINEAIASFKKSSWLKSAFLTVEGPSLDELKHYRHRLGSYANSIERYAKAMDEGIIPFRVVVTNAGARKDRQIAVKLTLTDGSLLLTRQAPQRPERPIGPQHVTELPSYDLQSVVSGFRRNEIRIGRKSLSSTFSELAPGEEAAVINQTLFIHLSPTTVFHYEIESEHLNRMTGDIPL